jgi:cyclic pyranopterin phosphate synthase
VADIDSLLEAAARLGITKVRFTGGEPLLREEIVDIVSVASKHMEDISISTNGVLLAPLARDLKAAGLTRVNVTLNSLSPETYAYMTGSDRHADVMLGIEEAYAAGLTPLKLNMVLIKRNMHELDDIIATIKKGMILQIIELIAPREGEGTAFYRENHVPIGPIEAYLAAFSMDVRVRNKHNRRVYCLPQHVEVVGSMHNKDFCRNCSSIRVTSEGYIKKCLFDNDHLARITDFSDTDAVARSLEGAIREKHPYW